MCCGQKRSLVRSNPIRRAAPAPPQTAFSHSRAQAGQTHTSIRYLGSAPLRVRGPVTGHQYEFSGAHSVHAVDSRDAASLLRTRFFRPAALGPTRSNLANGRSS